MVCFIYFGFIRFFYTGQVPKGGHLTDAVADPSKVLKKTGEMKKDILHSNLILFLKLSDFYNLAELKESVEDSMIEKLDEGNYEEFLVGATVHGLPRSFFSPFSVETMLRTEVAEVVCWVMK